MHPAVVAYLTDDVPRKLSWAKPEKKVETPPKPNQKGVCRFCGEHIGRGVAFHEKTCTERPE